MIAVVVLAAGRGRRLGGVAKALLERDQTTFLEAIAASARGAGVASIAVVTGPPYEAEVAAHARSLSLAAVSNPRPDRGMASSVALGFEWVAATCADHAGALLWPVDHDGVSSMVVKTLCDALPDRGSVVVPRFRGRGGHPVLFGAALWPELIACVDSQDGARSVVRRDPGRVISIAVDEPAVVRDVDVPADLPAAGEPDA